MKIHSGIAKFGKREEENMRLVLRHVKADLSYGGGGTFSKGDRENTFDEKEAKKAEEGIRDLTWLLDFYSKR